MLTQSQDLCAKVATLLICMVCRRSYFSMIAILLLRNPQTSVGFISGYNHIL